MTCTAGIRIKRKLKDLSLKGQLVITVHDSLIYEVPLDEVLQTFKVIKEEMERPIAGVTVPMQVDLKIGTRWGHTEDATLEDIEKNYGVTHATT